MATLLTRFCDRSFNDKDGHTVICMEVAVAAFPGIDKQKMVTLKVSSSRFKGSRKINLQKCADGGFTHFYTKDGFDPKFMHEEGRCICHGGQRFLKRAFENQPVGKFAAYFRLTPVGQ